MSLTPGEDAGIKVKGTWKPSSRFSAEDSARPQVIVFYARNKKKPEQRLKLVTASFPSSPDDDAFRTEAARQLDISLEYYTPLSRSESPHYLTLVYNPKDTGKSGSTAATIVQARPCLILDDILLSCFGKENRQAVVWMEASLDAGGAVQGISIDGANRNIEPLRESIEAVIKLWKFAPAKANGVNVASTIRFPMPFVSGGNDAPALTRRVEANPEYWLKLGTDSKAVRSLDQWPSIEVATPVAPADLPQISGTPGFDFLKPLIARPIIVSVTINPEGRISLSPVAPHEWRCVKVLAKALESWRFAPPLNKGKPCSVEFEAAVSLVSRAELESTSPRYFFTAAAEGPKPASKIPDDLEYWFSILARPIDTAYPDDWPRLDVAVPVKPDEMPDFNEIPGKERIMALLFSPQTVSMKITAKGGVKIEPMNIRQEGLALVLNKALADWKFSPAIRDGKTCAVEFEAAVTLVWRRSLEGKAPVPLFSIDAFYPGEYVKVEEKSEQVRNFGVGAQYIPGVTKQYTRRFDGTVDMLLEIDSKGFVVRSSVLKASTTAFEAPAITLAYSSKYLPSGSEAGVKQVNSVFEFGRGFKKAAKMQFMIVNPSATAPGGCATLTRMAPPIFPRAIPASVKEGMATASIFIDEKGRVTDVNITEASMSEFGLALQAALEASSFDPVRRDGIAVPTVIQRTEKFKRSGFLDGSLVLVLNADNGKCVVPEELDQPLTSTVRQAAVFPLNFRGKRQAGEAVVEFVVSRNGFVQEPVVVSATAPAFGYAAVQAVSAWGFVPPRKKGQAVSVKTRAVIQFTAPPADSNS